MAILAFAIMLRVSSSLAATPSALQETTTIKPRYVARPTLELTHTDDPPLRMPTTVSIGPDGSVYVADGVNDRILRFDPAGNLVEEIGGVADERLLRPVSARVDSSGRLWIADTGHGRVLVRRSDGTLERQIVLERGALDHAPDITDVTVSVDGRRAWLVDNDNHQLVAVDLDTGTQTVVGGPGESLGQFQHPFLIAVAADGDLFVSDVINARVQIISARGQPAGSIGTYGVDLGQLYRPKGVACDADGNVWISDGVLGAIQVFSPRGEFRGVLCDEAGRPLKFDTPVGLAFDAAGALYVAELQPARIRKLEITIEPRAQAPARAGTTASVGGRAARACTVCHLEWLAPLAEGRGTLLLDAPVDAPEQPVVSRSETCLSCHDSSVADSRRRVWLEHGHGTDIEPPPGMVVPPTLPLVNGRIACRTCHSAHGTGAPEGDISTAVFLRVPNPASELCMSCHPDKTRGPALGTHPTGGMPWPVPQELVDAGARRGPNPRELTCQVCHTPHGAAHDHLLVLGVESNQLCLTCHDQMRPGMFRDGAAEHPLSPPANAEQVAAVGEMGTRLGPGQRLICLSCHKLHHGKGQRYMLAAELHDGELCLRCHEERRDLLGSAHDLRRNFPEERNRLGMTAETGGPCSSCHMFHRYARAPEASDIDPGGGKCITCHQEGRVAAHKALPELNHAGAPCTACHNPHDAQTPHFLAGTPADLCAGCHANQMALLGGPHDSVQAADKWPAAAVATHDRCLACHRPHGTLETGRFRVLPVDGTPGPADVCRACHADADFGAQSAIAMLHPRDVTKLPAPATLPVLTIGDEKQLTCYTCHDPHRGGAPDAKLLRVADGATAHDLCVGCHTEQASLHAIGHAPEVLRAAGFDAAVCGPCHIAHGSPQSIEPRLLWSTQISTETVSPLAAFPDRHCVACHRVGGPVAPPAIATHPRADMYNPDDPNAPGFLPLFDERGAVDPKGTHACRTCHLTHGRSTPLPLSPNFSQAAPREVRARAWHLRTFSGTNVCTTCHGFDALRRFMYFHDPARRGGPIEGSSQPAPTRPSS